MTTASDLADELEAAGEGYMRTLKPAWTGDNRDEALALVIVVADNLSEILSALRRVEVMEKALGLLNGDQEIKPMLEARLDRLLDHHEHFCAVGGPNDSATFQWSDQVALLNEAVLALRARQALTGEA